MVTPITTAAGFIGLVETEGEIAAAGQFELAGQQFVAEEFQTGTPSKGIKRNYAQVTPSPRGTMPNRANTKRIRHHEREHTIHRNSVRHDEVTQNERVGKLYIRRMRLPNKSTIEGMDTENPRYSVRDDDIYIKGLKILREWHGRDSSYTSAVTPSNNGFMGDVLINWALIQFDCPQDPANDETLRTELLAEWWSTHEGENRGRAFTELLGVETSTASSESKFQHYWTTGAINPHHSKQFKILAREQRSARQVIQNWAGGPGQKVVARLLKYYKIPTPVYLHNNEEKSWQNPLYEVCWLSPFNIQALKNYTTVSVAGATEPIQFTELGYTDLHFKDLDK